MPSAALAPSPRSASSPHLAALPGPAAEPSARWLFWVLLGLALVPRLAVFPFNENFFGDSVVHTELAQRWARAPHWISAYNDGSFQFGPLHIYLVGSALKVWHSAEHAGRLVSLLFGVLAAWPLFALTRRLFGWKAGLWAVFGFSLWGMHLQFSTTAGSEAISLCLMLGVFALVARGLEEGTFAPLFFSALLLNLACATRYDAWLFIPFLTAVLFFQGTDRIAATTRAVIFGLLCLPFPLLWMQGNEVAMGDPFYPIHDVEKFHREWAPGEVAHLGEPLFRLQALLFWPATALFTLSPGIALLGAGGMVRAWKTERASRWLILAALVPAAYFTFKGAVLLNFVPLGRFTVTQLVLLLPFVGPGFEALTEQRGALVRKAVLGATVAFALAVPFALGLYTFRQDGGWRDTVRPVSPLTTNPVPVMKAARFLQREATAKGLGAALDDAPLYMDLQVAYFSALPELRIARYRWDTFRQRMAEKPAYLVRFKGGNLVRDPGVKLEGRALWVDGALYEELDGFQPPVHVYRRAD